MPGFRKGGKYSFRVVPSGYEFLGPGNEVLYQIPRNYNDAVAREHDIQYGRIQQRGGNPYTTFNVADEKFLNDLQPDDLATFAAKFIFQTKKALAQVGILHTDTQDVGTCYTVHFWFILQRCLDSHVFADHWKRRT